MTAEPVSFDHQVPFDVCGPLPPPGVTVLEASAGTGKTFTIAALVARLVADGVPVEQILAVTFTRMATGELRDRVRSRLVEAEQALTRLIDTGEGPPAADQVLGALAQGDPGAVRVRRDRIAAALADFDAATITTTHGFCQLVLTGLGVAGKVATGATLVEDVSDIVTDTIDDLFVRRAFGWGDPPFDRAKAQTVGRAALDNPATPLVPDPDDTVPGRQRRLADSTRREVERRLRDANILTYDDLLVLLKQALEDEEWGNAACSRLRERYCVALVDEFQDTDPVQWDVVRRAFGTGETTLVLIGDPKQAIYAFRGADVYAYLNAARRADRRYSLTDNWRSDAGLLRAYDALFDPLRLGQRDIAYRAVDPAPVHHEPGLVGAPVAAPLRARILHTDGHDLPLNRNGTVEKNAAVEFTAGDLAADVVRLLGSGATLARGHHNSAGAEPCRIAPGDIAVLVQTNRQAATIQQTLIDAGVPAVVAGAESVFTTPAAGQWLRLLEALEEPASRGRAAAVALGWFMGLPADQLAVAGEDSWEEIHARLHRWSDILRRRGIAALARTVTVEGLPGRVLAGPGGERTLTDLTHVAQLLHAESSSSQLGPSALRGWLERRIETADTEATDADVRSRRLESDADAVQVLTIHRAKGLEFPVVYCPFLWDPGTIPNRTDPLVFHDAEGRRLLDVGLDAGPARDDRREEAVAEARGESLRLMYVALTRARHHAVIWWVRGYGCQDSPLGRLLLARHGDGLVATSGAGIPDDEEVGAALVRIAGRADGRISVEKAGGPDSSRWQPPPPLAADLEAARFVRHLDLAWRRTSYTAITAAAHEIGRVGSEPEDPGITDEPAAPPPQPAPAEGRGALADIASPMADIPGGADVGTFVHGVLEQVDFTGADLPAAFRHAIAAARALRPARLEDADGLASALAAAASTPLGPIGSGLRLADIGRRDRLDELGFELPLGGGDRAGGQVTIRALADLLAAHVPAGDALAEYPARLTDPAVSGRLRGYLNGSLDLVARLPGHPVRFLVADYKTNWLGGEEPLTLWHYRPDALAAEMIRAHYPLQALLYVVALHRYLRWRLPDYEPDRNLAGVAYLFLRGMAGPDTPIVEGQPCGVFTWRPSAALVTAVSDLFDTGDER